MYTTLLDTAKQVAAGETITMASLTWEATRWARPGRGEDNQWGWWWWWWWWCGGGMRCKRCAGRHIRLLSPLCPSVYVSSYLIPATPFCLSLRSRVVAHALLMYSDWYDLDGGALPGAFFDLLGAERPRADDAAAAAAGAKVLDASGCYVDDY